MRKNRTIGILALLSLSLIFTACGEAVNGTPTEAPEMLFTRVAETIFYSVTQTAEAMPTLTPTPIPPTPTVTIIVLPTIKPTTSTVLPTVGVTQSSSTGSHSGDYAVWKYNRPDNFEMKAGSSINNEVIGLMNVGTTTWNTKYTLRFVGGTQMWDVVSVAASKAVKPGESIEFFMPVFAPTSKGTYLSYWALFTDTGLQVPGSDGYIKVIVP